ncbi:MAG TPA: hypothetical protein VI915_00960 [Thermoplasmata archaeon]|nr:hypothetical protein [Thermoplasmata archaeon]
MAPAPRHLVFEYVPIPVSPMGVALLLLAAIVTFLLGPIAAYPEGLWPLGGLCFLPFVVLLVWVLANRPSTTQIYAEGIEISLPLWRRAAGTRRFYPWEEVVNVFPASYEISGAFLSPFASSAGTLVHTGIGLETAAGERLTVKFTPGAIRAFRGETEGYRRAMEAVREVFAARGRPLVSSVRAYTDDEVKGMQAEAREPLLGMATIVLAFLTPPALVAIVLLVMPLGPLAWGLAAVVALAPPVASIVVTYRRGRRRNLLLSELSKFQESYRRPA